MRGMLYGVGVGPGDPELMTLKAVRVIREAEVIAVPGKTARESVAYRIAAQAVPELADKRVVSIDFPMTKDEERLRESHRTGANQLEKILDTGKDVAFLTLGDVTIYSTFSYIQKLAETDGYRTELVSGVPSFCAAGASLKIPLTEGKEMLHVIPASYQEEVDMKEAGTYILMKTGRKLRSVKEQLHSDDFRNESVFLVENSGMTDEKIYRTMNEIPDKTGYFSTLIAKKDKGRDR
jgi:precorrin-2/cobalt-factor-2 C20-methyltransferase